MKLINHLESAFCRAQDATNAIGMAAYMKHLFPFYGIKKPERALIQKQLFKEYPINSEASLITALELLWSKPEREYQYTALDLAYRHNKLWSPKLFPLFETFIRSKSWWDTVDLLAGKLVGIMLSRYPELVNTMDAWIEDEYLWIRRSALLYQLNYKENTNQERLFAYCSATMHEQEFFIRKAIGWSLRQYAKTNPHEVNVFLQQHKQDLSPLSFKEAAKHLELLS